MSQETKIASLEYALELASRDAVEECDRARSAEARVQQLEEALRDATDFMRLVLTSESLNEGFTDEALSNGLKWLAGLEAALSRGEAPEKEGE